MVPFFIVLYMIAYQSALISRKFPCPKNVLVTRMLLGIWCRAIFLTSWYVHVRVRTRGCVRMVPLQDSTTKKREVIPILTHFLNSYRKLGWLIFTSTHGWIYLERFMPVILGRTSNTLTGSVIEIFWVWIDMLLIWF